MFSTYTQVYGDTQIYRPAGIYLHATISHFCLSHDPIFSLQTARSTNHNLSKQDKVKSESDAGKTKLQFM